MSQEKYFIFHFDAANFKVLPLPPPQTHTLTLKCLRLNYIDITLVNVYAPIDDVLASI